MPRDSKELEEAGLRSFATYHAIEVFTGRDKLELGDNLEISPEACYANNL